MAVYSVSMNETSQLQCPVCTAKPGECCRTESGIAMRRVHRDRTGRALVATSMRDLEVRWFALGQPDMTPGYKAPILVRFLDDVKDRHG